MLNPSPVVLFAYNRPAHLRRVIDALLASPEAARTCLFVFSDAPASDNQSSSVEAVRSYLGSIHGFGDVTVIERSENFGLSRNIIGGIGSVLQEHESCIVLEDDLLPSPHFLRYMNDGLECYRDEQDVISIVGYFYPTSRRLPETFFLPFADCWGWATWRRGWSQFRPDGAALLRELQDRGLERAFNINGTYPFMEMLKGQILGRNDSWAIRWRASAFLSGKLSLFPGRSLIRNIGNDGSGRHSAPTTSFDTTPSADPITVSRIPVRVADEAMRADEEFWRRHHPSIAIRALRKARRILTEQK